MKYIRILSLSFVYYFNVGYGATPVVVDDSTSAELSAVTSHTVLLPPSISSGDLLIVCFGVSFPDADDPQFPAGWTRFFWEDQSAGSDAGIAGGYRQADGGEGASITVTTTNSTKSAHVSFRITGHLNPATQAPEATTSKSTNSQTDSPSLTPTGGAKDYLWFTVAGRTIDDAGVQTEPANYGNVLEKSGGTGSGGILTHTARRALNASSEDPGAWSGGDATAEWAAATVAIHPAAAPPTGAGRGQVIIVH
jgi:hypothetical protein